MKNDPNAAIKIPVCRPIISQIGTATERIGHYTDHFLVPIVKSQDTYIRDTADFIAKIESLRIPDNCLLLSYDITSMYTNMTFNELLTAARSAVSKFDIREYINIPYPDTDDLVFLLQCILENNIFEFNNKYYKQTIGSAMGSRPSAELADIRMHEITSAILSQYSHKDKILFHGRFRDDGFMIIQGSIEEAKQFFTIANSYHQLLKFTYEISESSMIFLDTEIYKGKRFKDHGILDIKLYTKPTNTFQYLHRSSAHNASVFKGFIKGECIRYARNTSDPSILQTELNKFKTRLLKRGYSLYEIQPIIQKFFHINRKELLKIDKCIRPKQHPNVMVTKFDPRIKHLKKDLTKYWHKLIKDDRCKLIFQTEPMVAYSKHKNIGDIVTSSLLPSNEPTTQQMASETNA